MSDFKINLGAITNGSSLFSFEIKDTFFEAYTFSEVRNADITATALLEKNSKKLELNLSIDGQIHKLLCDICAEELSIDISAETKVIIQKTNDDLISTDEIFYVKIKNHLFKFILFLHLLVYFYFYGMDGDSIQRKI